MNTITPLDYGQPSYGAPSAARSDRAFGLMTIWEIIIRRLPLIVPTMIVVAVLGAAIVMLLPPKYSSTAVVIINPRQERVVSQQQALTDLSPTAALVESEMELLRSPTLARQLVEALRLAEDPEWNVRLRPPSLLAQLTGAKPLRGTAEETNELVAERVLRAIKVRRRALSYVIDVTATSKSPAKAAQIANQVVRLYMQLATASRVDTSEQAGAWLQSRLEELRKDVQDKEAAAQAYRVESGLLSSAGSTLTEQQVTSVQATVLGARADLAEKEARLRQVRDLLANGGSVDRIASAVNSEVIRDLRSREADLTRRQAELSNRYGDRHPTLEANRAEVDNIRAQISAEITRLSESLQNDVAVSRTRLQTMEGSLGNVRSELSENNAALVRLNQLEREAAASRSVYESFLQRSHEVSDQGRLNTEARIVATARPAQRPSSPNLLVALAVIFVATFGAGFGIALLAEFLDDALYDAGSVERMVGMLALTSIPTVPKRELRALQPHAQHPPGYIVEQPMSPFAEAFRVLRAAILYTDLHDAPSIVAVTSALPDEGKTTCALSLARVATLSGQRVLIVDCDLRRKSLNDLLSLKPKKGLMQVISGEANWEQALVEDEYTGLHILPMMEAAFVQEDVFGTARMRTLFNHLKAAYDLIILDCPPVLAVADVRSIARLADRVVVVARWGKTSSRAVLAAVDKVAQSGGSVMGVALNAVNLSAPSRYSYADSLYYREVKKYYQTA